MLLPPWGRVAMRNTRAFFALTLLLGLGAVAVVHGDVLLHQPSSGTDAHRATDLLSLEAFVFGMDSEESEKCHVDLSLLWHTKVGGGVYSSPVALDVGGDGDFKVVLTTEEHYVEVLEGRTGHKFPGWPSALPGRRMAVGPVWVDERWSGSWAGRMVISSVQGDLVALDRAGMLLGNTTLKVPPLRVERDWYAGMEGADASVDLHTMAHMRGAASTVGGPAESGARVFDGGDASAHAERSMDAPHMGTGMPGMGGWLPPQGIESLQLFLPTSAGRVHHDSLEDSSAQWAAWQRAHPEAMGDWLHHVWLDGHVLASPAIGDLNGDGRVILVVPVSYYFDPEDYASRPKRMRGLHMDRYMAGGIVAFDVEQQRLAWASPLRLTTHDGGSRILGGPQLFDVDRDGRLDVVVGDGAGGLYVLDAQGLSVAGWPRRVGPLHIPALVGPHGIAVLDARGQATCFTHDGQVAWARRVDAPPSSPGLLADVDGDGIVDVVWATESGAIWAIGSNGDVLDGFPLRMSSPSRGMAVLPLGRDLRLHLVIATSDGRLRVVDPSTRCVDDIDVGEPLSSPPLVHDVAGTGRMQVVVATTSGSVYAIGTKCPYRSLSITDNAHPGRSPLGGFMGGSGSARPFFGIEASSHHHGAVQHGGSFPVDVVVSDARSGSPKRYNLTMSVVSREGVRTTWTMIIGDGAHRVHLQSPKSPQAHASVHLHLMGEDGVEAWDSLTLRFHTHAARPLKWMVMVPIAVMCVGLLLLKQRTDPERALSIAMGD